MEVALAPLTKANAKGSPMLAVSMVFILLFLLRFLHGCQDGTKWCNNLGSCVYPGIVTISKTVNTHVIVLVAINGYLIV